MSAAAIAGLAVCLVLCALLLPSLRANLRLLRRIRRSRPLAEGAPPDDGPAAISGAAGGAALIAPLSGRPCVLWHIEVDEFRKGQNQSRWIALYHQTSGEHITVSSGALLAHVHITDTRLFLCDNLHQGRFAPLSAALRVRLQQLGMPTEGALGPGRRLRAVERLIAPGQQVFAQGEVEQIGGVPYLIGSRAAPLILTDQSERLLSERLRRSATASGAAAATLGLCALLLALMLLS